MTSPLYGNRSYGELGTLRPPGHIPDHLRQAPRDAIDKAQSESYSRLVRDLERLRDLHCPPGTPEPTPAAPPKPNAIDLGIPPAYRVVEASDFYPDEFADGIPLVGQDESVLIVGVDALFDKRRGVYTRTNARVSEYAAYLAINSLVRWSSVLALSSDLAQNPARERGEWSETKKLALTTRLVLDDIGSGLNWPRTAGHVTALLAARLESGPLQPDRSGRQTIVTSRHSLGELAETDPRIAELLSGMRRIRMAPSETKE